MSRRAYDVSLNAGRSLPATQKRLDDFIQFIARLDGAAVDSHMYKQSSDYIVVMVRVLLDEEHVATVRAHHSVWEMRTPPKVAW